MDTDRAESDRIQALEQSLIDERAARAEAQRRAAELERRVATWRERAEARAATIDSLERERDASPRAVQWVRGRLGQLRRGTVEPIGPVGPAASTTGSPNAQIRRMMPGTSIAHNVTGALAKVLDQAGAIGLDTHPWDAVDAVVIDPGRFSDLDRLDDWLTRTPRPPTIVVSDDPARWASADLVIGSSERRGSDALVVPEPIDLDAVALAIRSGVSQPSDTGPVAADDVGIDARLDASTSGAIATSAAIGVPVSRSEKERLAPGASTRARRWAWSHRDPAVVLARLLDAGGVRHTRPRPSVGGLLVSNRPDRVGSAIVGVMGQELALDELAVVCHGFGTDDVTRIVEEHGWHDRVKVVTRPASMTLGACTNEAAMLTSSTVLAKLDDDDFYGPGYLLDAVHALRYSGAAVVGKAAQFTYVESIDRTVLRRPGTEETFVDGTLTGATLVFERSMWDAVRFPDRPRMIDLHFLRGVRAAGGAVYANSRWEFVYRRGPAGHTWAADDDVFVQGAQPAWDGWEPDRACL